LSTNEPSRFSREFNLEALRRMEAGENASVLARELGFHARASINGVIGIGWAAQRFAQPPRSDGAVRNCVGICDAISGSCEVI
jgi:hypothetical protein